MAEEAGCGEPLETMVLDPEADVEARELVDAEREETCPLTCCLGAELVMAAGGVEVKESVPIGQSVG